MKGSQRQVRKVGKVVLIIAGLPDLLWLAGTKWFAEDVPAFLVK
jgi:hypothetical protein